MAKVDRPERLKAWRDRHGWSQAQAARELTVPIGTYRNWEQGRRGGNPPAILHLACAYIDHCRATEKVTA